MSGDQRGQREAPNPPKPAIARSSLPAAPPPGPTWDPSGRAMDRLVIRDREIERLRAHIKTLHRLNGWSKQKGWWCSCGESIQRTWVRYRDDEGGRVVATPWSPEGRRIATDLHDTHVNSVLFGPQPTAKEG